MVKCPICNRAAVWLYEKGIDKYGMETSNRNNVEWVANFYKCSEHGKFGKKHKVI